MNTKTLAVLGTTSLLSLATGAAVGYFFAKNRLGKEFDERLTKEIGSARRYYSKLHKRENYDMPTVTVEQNMLPIERDAAEAMQRYTGNNTVIDTPREEPERYETASFESNVFESTMQDDAGLQAYEDLIRNRTEEAPYVITLAEFMNNEYNHEQDSLVYFQQDGILVDAKDEVVPDPDSVVGDDNLVKFGHFSGDPKTVYVRNDALGLDFHIISHEGSYAYVVHGIVPEPANAGD